jgi:hypothetical protein
MAEPLRNRSEFSPVVCEAPATASLILICSGIFGDKPLESVAGKRQILNGCTLSTRRTTLSGDGGDSAECRDSGCPSCRGHSWAR